MHFVSHWFFTQILPPWFVPASISQNIDIQPPLPLLLFGSEGYSIVQPFFFFFFSLKLVMLPWPESFVTGVQIQKFFLVNMLRTISGVADSWRLWPWFSTCLPVSFARSKIAVGSNCCDSTIKWWSAWLYHHFIRDQREHFFCQLLTLCNCWIISCWSYLGITHWSCHAHAFGPNQYVVSTHYLLDSYFIWDWPSKHTSWTSCV